MGLIYYITQVQFDFGAIRLAAAECERSGIRRPLICTDKGVVAAGLLDRLRDALGDLPVAVFDATPSNPTESAVMAAVEAYRAHGADGLIALGGGSAIDLAKGVAIMATHPGVLADYFGTGFLKSTEFQLPDIPRKSLTEPWPVERIK